MANRIESFSHGDGVARETESEKTFLSALNNVVLPLPAPILKNVLDSSNNKGNSEAFSKLPEDAEIPESLSDIKLVNESDLKKDQYKIFSSEDGPAYAIQRKDDEIRFETQDGKRYLVSKENNPEAFDQLKTLHTEWGDVKEAISDGAKLLSPDDNIPVLTGDTKVKMLSDGVKLIDIPERGQYVVMEDYTSEHYSIITSDQVSLQTDAVDDAFADAGLPKGEETDIMMAETTEDGKSVSELYQEYMEEAYKDLPKDSKKAKYMRLLEAENMLSGGFQYLPYNTGPGRYGGSETEYADGMSELKAADARGMLDEGTLGDELAGLLTDEDIIADSEKFLDDAVDKIKNKDELEDKIADSMLDESYLETIESLGEDHAEGAQSRFSSDLEGLKLLNADRAEEVQNTLKFRVPISELNEIYKEGVDGVGEDNLLNASGDVASSLLQGIVTTLFGTKRGVDVYNKIINGEKVDVTPEERKKLDVIKSAHQALTNALNDQAGRNLESDNGRSPKPLSIDDIDKAIDKANVPLDQRGGVKGLLGGLVKSGTLSGAGGLVSMAAGIYKMSDGGLSLGETENERIEVARNFLSLVGVTPSLLNMTNEVYKGLSGNPGMGDALGIGKNLKDTWNKNFPTNSDAPPKSSIPSEFVHPDFDFGKESFSKDIWGQVSENLGETVTPVEDNLSELSDDEQDRVRRNIDSIAKDIRGPDIPDLDKKTKTQLVGGSLSLLGGLADAGGGTLDIVLGARGLDDLRKNGGEPIEFAQRSLQVGSGSFSSVMGLSSASEALGIAPQIATRVAAAAGLAGSVLGFVGAILGGVMAALADKKKEGVTEDIRDVFRDLSDDGVTEDDWGDKFNFTIHVEYSKSTEHDGRRDALFESWFPEDIPTWEAQPDKYKEFTETVSEDGEISESWISDFNGDKPDLVMHKYGHDFYDKNRDKIELLSRKWTEWDGSDDIVSRKDFEKILDDESTTKEEREAINLLLSDNAFFDLLDTFNSQWSGGRPKGTDGKISSKDLNQWRHLWIDQEREDKVEKEYSHDFYDENRDVIEYISRKWTDWDGSDDIVSRKDFEKLLDSDETSGEEKEAVQWLMDDPFFFDLLDTFAKGGKTDGKISSKDLNQWREQWIEKEHEEKVENNYSQSFYDEYRDTIEFISQKWTDWDGSDDIVSRKDFEKILDSDDTSDEEKEAVQWLMDDPFFFDLLDTFAKGGDGDGKISSKDLNKWREQWM
ncbi:hypothetical protein F0A16_05695 [Salinicola corii]|uniref:Uncharacterized protein n=1 Tax=Salinicola corii TaxID=2606937 RepID=A0A640WHC6_9GAMM|nr:HrpF/NolX family T3SS translocon protein [Salinicola corii]KAA0019813.1 hypothetical protein F0A16_05695 [Salinicola corii]